MERGTVESRQADPHAPVLHDPHRVKLDAEGKGHIEDVIPPDEYADHATDSVFTNAVAKIALEAAHEAAVLLGEAPDPKWLDVQQAVVLLMDEGAGIHPEYRGYSGQVRAICRLDT